MPLTKLAKTLQEAGGQALLVGGAVRDDLLGLPCKDMDIEVFGLEASVLQALLEKHFRVDLVGEAFGVLKVRVPGLEEAVDISLPRWENKTGSGHKGFEVLSDPSMSFEEAAQRRDLTINALSRNLHTGELLDFHGGLEDLKNGVLREASPERFHEDPLRVLRVAQFAARLEFRVSKSLLELCKPIDVSELPAERLGEEWHKLLTKGKRPSLGMNFLRDCGQLRHVPEILAMVGCPQDPEWHPEGDVFVHTGFVCDAAVQIANREGLVGNERWVLMLAALAHDLGKPQTTAMIGGRLRSPGHTSFMEPTETLMERLMVPLDIRAAVVPLVKEHLAHSSLGEAPSAKAVRRLSTRLAPANLRLWGLLLEADCGGRPPLPGGSPGASILALAEELAVMEEPPKPILMGRHLLTQGLKPGPQFGILLGKAFEAQLDGEFDSVEGGFAFLGM